MVGSGLGVVRSMLGVVWWFWGLVWFFALAFPFFVLQVVCFLISFQILSRSGVQFGSGPSSSVSGCTFSADCTFALRLVCQTARSEAPGQLAFCQQALSVSGCMFSADCTFALRLDCQLARKKSSNGVGGVGLRLVVGGCGGCWRLYAVVGCMCVCCAFGVVLLFFRVLCVCALVFHRMGKGPRGP